ASQAWSSRALPRTDTPCCPMRRATTLCGTAKIVCYRSDSQWVNACFLEERSMVDAPAMPRQRPGAESPPSAAEVANVPMPTLHAHVLPPRTFHDQDVFDYEQNAWFAGDWVSVGREEDALK